MKDGEFQLSAMAGVPVTLHIDIDKVVSDAVAREFDSRAAAGQSVAPHRVQTEEAIRDGAVAREFSSRAAAGQSDTPQDPVRDQIEKAITDADAREADAVTRLKPGVVPVFSAYSEIKNVLEIKNDLLYKTALKEWDRKEAYLGNRVDRREKASADLVNQIFNIVGFFSVFQGVVLTAVSQLKSGTSTCGIIWFPIVLSSASAVVAIAGVSIKFRNLNELEISILAEKVPQSESCGRAQRLREHGKKYFRFVKDTKEPAKKKPKSFQKFKTIKLCAYHKSGFF